ncbi:tRNA (guanine-N7-)-methyltransferase [Nematocida sp. LUAm3]|nr:tRNA (guanine-N7-)-methyltransferase [Nematocida sp. LUAm3]KAI5174059.1 tRNA (guanine-N7-)-methyltransferase [Nematocida sp. LUAm2]KAI5177198.1 tRNA (guanine-N7-)-methyltransferase [Nematocida sp. LUAm1]
MKAPQKRNHRQRAHCNPFSDHDIEYPLEPSLVKPAHMVDIGCGYGGLLFHLSEAFPDKHILGMEIRKKLVDYVDLKIQYLQSEENKAKNIEITRTNSMKFLPNYFSKGSLEKMFILFPDPHFKKRKQKGRIISAFMLDIYQYVLQPGGLLYISTDVESLFLYMKETIDAHWGFTRMSEEEEERDSLWSVIIQGTEESKKADKKHSEKYRAIFKTHQCSVQ